jgi:tetratricopeptide (TPR) repeat protein
MFDLEVEQERYAEAEQLIIELIREHPGNAAFLACYAQLMLFTLNLGKARALVDAALELDASNLSARRVDVLLSLVEGRRERAESRVEELVAEDPNYLRVGHVLLESLIAARRFADALEVAQQMLRVAPHHENMMETIISLRAQTHWLSLPLWPSQRWGWMASGVAWGAAMLVFTALRGRQPQAALVFGAAYLAWAIYTWAYGPLMTRWLRWRGVR